MIRVFIFFILLLLGACSRPESMLSDGQFDENAPGDSLHAVRISIDGEFLGGNPVLAVGNRIFIRNRYGQEKNYSVYVLSGDSLKKEGEFLNFGRGPYEMSFPDLSYDRESRQLNMLANRNMENRFCRVRVDSPGDFYDITKWEYKQLPFISKNSMDESCLFDGSVFLMMGYHADSLNMFSLLDIDKEQVIPLDFQYPDIPVELSPICQQIFWAGPVYKHPNRNRFLYSAQDFKYIFIFDLDEHNRVHIVRNLYDILPEFHPSGDKRHPYSFDNSCEYGGSHMAVDDEYIYVGYTQTTYGQIRDLATARKSIIPITSPRRINVYDWDGNFVRRLILDKAIGPMVITENQIVAVHTDPETAEECFVRYQL